MMRNRCIFANAKLVQKVGSGCKKIDILLFLETYIVKTFQGLEGVLAEELTALGAAQVEIHRRMVSFEGDKALMYRANLHLRTALRILQPIKEQQIENEDQLYEFAKSIDWSQYMSNRNTLAVDSVVNSPHFHHSKFAALRVKDAIVDQFREKTRRRPSVDVRTPDLRVNLFINDTRCSLAVDTSGGSLHRRGYRLNQYVAPLNEVLAAGIIKLSGWDENSHLFDPMCGAGTLLIEAVSQAINRPPQWQRAHFGFTQATDFDAKLWADIRSEAAANIKEPEGKFFGADLSDEALSAARANLIRAGLNHYVRLRRNNFFDTKKIPFKKGIIITNPPYDMRLQEEDINEFYKEIGNVLKRQYDGYDAWIFSGEMTALKSIGLKTSRSIPLYNGPIECKLRKFEMYEGTKNVEPGVESLESKE